LRIGQTSHLLINGDSRSILKVFPDDSIDIILTDPPYNRELNYGSYFKDKMSKKQYYLWCFGWLREFARILAESGSLYLISYPEISAYFLIFLDNVAKLKFRRWLVWHYPTNIGHSPRNFTRSHRAILFYSKTDNYIFNREEITQHYKNPEVKKIKDRLQKGVCGRAAYDVLRFTDIIEVNEYIDVDDVLSFLDYIEKSEGLIDVLDFNLLKNVSKDRVGSKREGDVYYHPCQLPAGLIRVLVKVSTNEGMCVLDPFAGTFSVSAVAARIGRNSIGIEINPYFIDLGLERLRKVGGADLRISVIR
jgi:DNA modification methylase